VWGEENRMREENRTQGQGEKKKWGLSWTQTPFYSRFKVFVFLGLMVTPTTIFFPLVTTYINAHNFVLIPLTMYTLNLNPSHIHIRTWI
jgi:hypothetical protein